MPVRDVPFLDKDQNIVAWADRQLMPGHLYEDFTTHDARDPEGLLSDIPALGTTLIGLLTGLWLRAERSAKAKALGLVVGAAACLALGYLWSLWFPLNKKMWTSSYVLVSAGWSLTIFALFYWAIDFHGWCKKGWSKRLVSPWLIFGSNAIVAYMISELLGSAIELVRFTVDGDETDALHYAHAHIFAHISDLGWRAFAYSVSYTFLCFVPVWLMYRKKIFLKV
jgi:predicted acyltransferase